VRDSGARAIEGSEYVGSKEPFPYLLGQAFQIRKTHEFRYTRVVYQDIQPPEPLNACLNQLAALRVPRDIGLDDECFGSFRTTEFRSFLGFGSTAAVVDHHPATSSSESQGGCTPHAGVADYLTRNGYWVSALYTSNVEQYLFANGVFSSFAENVAKLPITDKSIFIRAFPNMREPHPAKISGHRLTTLLEKISVFLKDNDQGRYQDYWSLVTTNYIAADPNCP